MSKPPYGYNDEAETIHEKDQLFCYDQDCGDREDPERIKQLGEWYNDGLVSADDADKIYRGKTI